MVTPLQRVTDLQQLESKHAVETKAHQAELAVLTAKIADLAAQLTANMAALTQSEKTTFATLQQHKQVNIP